MSERVALKEALWTVAREMDSGNEPHYAEAIAVLRGLARALERVGSGSSEPRPGEVAAADAAYCREGAKGAGPYARMLAALQAYDSLRPEEGEPSAIVVLAEAAQAYLTAEATVGVTEQRLRELNHRLGSLAGPHLRAWTARQQEPK